MLTPPTTSSYRPQADYEIKKDQFNIRIHEILSGIPEVTEIEYEDLFQVIVTVRFNRLLRIKLNIWLNILHTDPVWPECSFGDKSYVFEVPNFERSKLNWTLSDEEIKQAFTDSFLPYFHFAMEEAERAQTEMIESRSWKEDTLNEIQGVVSKSVQDGDVLKWPSQFKKYPHAALAEDPREKVVRLILNVDIATAKRVLSALKGTK